MNYSETEQIVGKWIDGRDVFAKVFTTPINVENYWNTVLTGVDIERVLDFFGWSSQDVPRYPILHGRNTSVRITNSNLEIYSDILNPLSLKAGDKFFLVYIKPA